MLGSSPGWPPVSSGPIAADAAGACPPYAFKFCRAPAACILALCKFLFLCCLLYQVPQFPQRCTATTLTARPCKASLLSIRCLAPAGSSARRRPRPMSHHGTVGGDIATPLRRSCALHAILCPSTSHSTWRTRTHLRLATFLGSMIAAVLTTATAVAAVAAVSALAVAAVADAIAVAGRAFSHIRVRLQAHLLHVAPRPGTRASSRLHRAGLGVALSPSVLRSPL